MKEMCGIAGAYGKDAQDQVQGILEVIKHRGPDGIGVFSDGDIAIGNVQLNITGKKKQPISNGGALTFNGEIYNFRDLSNTLNIQTDSDSQLLFELIKKKGIEAAISELDGDYAFAYAENGTIYLVRDLIGVKPLFYSLDNGFAFASEKKALTAAGKIEINSLKPGNMLSVSKEGIIEKKMDGFSRGEILTDMASAKDLLSKALERSVEKRDYKPCAIAFSGGLDSSILAALCKDAELYSVGMAGSHDIYHAKRAAEQLGILDKLHLHEVTTDELENAIPLVIKAIESRDPHQASIALPLYFASKDAHLDGIRVMLSGQGADELFAGYKRYESMKVPELSAALEKDISNIAVNNLERDDAVTMANSVELRVPFLDGKVVELALSIAPELKIHNGIRKYVLRLAAQNLIPDELVWKKKKAAQYSSGIYSAMEKLERKRN